MNLSYLRITLIVLVPCIFLDYSSSATTVSPNKNLPQRIWQPSTSGESRPRPLATEKVQKELNEKSLRSNTENFTTPTYSSAVVGTTRGQQKNRPDPYLHKKFRYALLQASSRSPEENHVARVLTLRSQQENNLQNEPGLYRHKKFRSAPPQASAQSPIPYTTPQTTTFNYQAMKKPVCESHKALHKRVDSSEKPHKCRYCPKIFSCISKKKVHETSVHLGKKPYVCANGVTGFSRKRNIKQHEIIHTDKEPHKCTHCGRGFAYYCLRVKHERIHTGEKPFKCQYCDKGFEDNSSKVRHELVHTGEKPFKCKYCGKAFRLNSARVNHERIHTGEKPYKCQNCNKGFANRSNKAKHERKHCSKKQRKCR